MDDFEAWDDGALLAATSPAGETFAVFYRRHVPAVLAFYARRRVDPHRAGDLTAETFAAALLSRHRYRPERAAARAWLLGIAAHKLADSGRRRARDDRALRALMIERVPLTERDVADYAGMGSETSEGDRGSPDTLAGGAETVHGASLAAGLDELPPAQRVAVRERVLDERSYREIAERHHISDVLARQRVSRGLAALRARLRATDSERSTR